MYFIDLDDGDYKDTIRNARRKLEVPMEAPMPCKKGARSQASSSETGAKNDGSGKISKTKYACIVEARESTRQRRESSLPKHHDDNIVWCTSSSQCRKR